MSLESKNHKILIINMEKQERLRFNIKVLLIQRREVIALNLYEGMNLWKKIHDKIMMATGKTSFCACH